MRLGGSRRRRLGWAVTILGLTVLDLGRADGDEPGRLGRLFRLGPPPAARTPAAVPEHAAPPPLPIVSEPDSPATTTGPLPRLVPQPRVNRPITEADPILTRVMLGRADDGKRFGMFLQVFADGTVIDSEGVHRVAPEALRPVVQAIQSGDLGRLRGHCGGPSTDFVEQVHVVVYERSLGRLRAQAFSYSGNPQGCDPSVRHLHAALDALQAKLSGSAPVAAPAATIPTPSDAKPITLSSP